MSRAALFAAGALGTALAMSECSSSQALYGAAPVDVTDAGDAASGEGGSVMALYGGVAPPVDAGDAKAVDAPPDQGSAQPLYGAVVPPADSGNETG